MRHLFCICHSFAKSPLRQHILWIYFYSFGPFGAHESFNANAEHISMFRKAFIAFMQLFRYLIKQKNHTPTVIIPSFCTVKPEPVTGPTNLICAGAHIRRIKKKLELNELHFFSYQFISFKLIYSVRFRWGNWIVNGAQSFILLFPGLPFYIIF